MPRKSQRAKPQWVSVSDRKESIRALIDFNYCKFYLHIVELDDTFGYKSSVVGPALDAVTEEFSDIEDCKTWCELVVDEHLGVLQQSKRIIV